ncbi:glycoside hydrolase family 16 protein [Phlebiopsis gigantea 11061_1 CR5-6]|uniref:Glycoside hydrolase family 16 protein n=1 Tax=Phlebiopsis gigantea (strain 11061_1 CR5-6) TaxID=745531 RepID=A0A0C3RRV6_PHLG1|nr:glycoside hydrolase family 16 protein [Phlebiopsis gigantea 11061_1 CR5-6]
MITCSLPPSEDTFRPRRRIRGSPSVGADVRLWALYVEESAAHEAADHFSARGARVFLDPAQGQHNDSTSSVSLPPIQAQHPYRAAVQRARTVLRGRARRSEILHHNGSDTELVLEAISGGGRATAQYDQQIHLILDLAVGGTSGAFPDGVGRQAVARHVASAAVLLGIAEAQKVWVHAHARRRRAVWALGARVHNL